MLRLLFPLVAVAAFAPPRRSSPALLRRASAAIDPDAAGAADVSTRCSRRSTPTA